MQHTTLIVPGFRGSGPAHWQTWFETQVPGARRVSGIDWEQPVLPHWAQAVRDGAESVDGVRVSLYDLQGGEVEPFVDLIEEADGLAFENELGCVSYSRALALDAAGRTLALDTRWNDGAIEIVVPQSFLANARFTTADFFPMFDVPLAYGRAWTGADDQARTRVAVISPRAETMRSGSREAIGASASSFSIRDFSS